MGRKKIELKRIECPKEKSSKYSKRKKGLFKKAEEMAILCDSDVILLVFSPTSKPTIYYSRAGPLSRILEKLSNMSVDEREERRIYTIKTLKKQLKKNNTEILSENRIFSSGRDEVLQDDDKVTALREVRELLDENTSILRDWENPYRVDDLARLEIMEDYLVSTLSQIRKLKIQEE